MRSVREGWDSRDIWDTAHHRCQDLAAAAATVPRCAHPVCLSVLPGPDGSHRWITAGWNGVPARCEATHVLSPTLPVSPPAPRKGFWSLHPGAAVSRASGCAPGRSDPAASSSTGSVPGARGPREGAGGSRCPAQTPASPGEPELPREMGRLWDERRPRQGWDAAAVNQLLSSNKMDISHMK